MAAAPDPNRMRPGDEGWAHEEPGSDKAARFGMSSGLIAVVVVALALAFLAVVAF